MENTNGSFFCYSLKLYHFICAFGEKCCGSSVNRNSGSRYWVFKKSKRLDEIICSFNEMKHKFDS